MKDIDKDIDISIDIGNGIDINTDGKKVQVFGLSSCVGMSLDHIHFFSLFTFVSSHFLQSTWGMPEKQVLHTFQHVLSGHLYLHGRDLPIAYRGAVDLV